MELEGKLEIQVWKHDYIYDRSKPNLMQLLGLEEDDKKITYEDIFDAINFDLEGKECKIDGIDDARKLPQWNELNHSNNFELRWCCPTQNQTLSDTQPDKIVDYANYTINDLPTTPNLRYIEI